MSPVAPSRHDKAFKNVAAGTGYPAHEVASRGVSFCRKNPRIGADDFDVVQAPPTAAPGIADDADPAIIRVDLYNDPVGEPPYETGVDLRESFPENEEYEDALDRLRVRGHFWAGGGAAPLIYGTLSAGCTLPPRAATSGPVDRDHAAEADTLAYDPVAVEHRLADAQAAAQRVTSLPIELRQNDVKGGVSLIGKIDGRTFVHSDPMSTDEAERLAPEVRGFLRDLAGRIAALSAAA